MAGANALCTYMVVIVFHTQHANSYYTSCSICILDSCSPWIISSITTSDSNRDWFIPFIDAYLPSACISTYAYDTVAVFCAICSRCHCWIRLWPPSNSKVMCINIDSSIEDTCDTERLLCNPHANAITLCCCIWQYSNIVVSSHFTASGGRVSFCW